MSGRDRRLVELEQRLERIVRALRALEGRGSDLELVGSVVDLALVELAVVQLELSAIAAAGLLPPALARVRVVPPGTRPPLTAANMSAVAVLRPAEPVTLEPSSDHPAALELVDDDDDDDDDGDPVAWECPECPAAGLYLDDDGDLMRQTIAASGICPHCGGDLERV